jgi:hypothetical protein
MCILLLASAMADTDFINTTATLDFAVDSMPGDTYCINVSITDDSVLEGDKTFNVALTLTTSDPNIMLGTDMTTITITDDDSECLYVYSYQLVNSHIVAYFLSTPINHTHFSINHTLNHTPTLALW